MKYLFPRKVILGKESKGVGALPGGFGTQDDTFELFTLQQTGKSVPAPVVLLDVPGGTYWTSWLDFVRAELVAGGLVSPGDLALFCITDDVDEACEELVGFYRNVDSIRWAGARPIISKCRGPDDATLDALHAHPGAHLH